VALTVGIVGLPNAGKSSLFNALSRAGAAVASYPFTTIEPHHGVAPVPDPRLAAVASVTHPDRMIPATVDFVDIAGLVRGAARGEGLGNQFLAHIREVDALAHVVRCFPAPDVPHVEGALDPVRDLEIVETELALSDLAVVERELERVRTRVKAHDLSAPGDVTVLEEVATHLQRGMAVRHLPRDAHRESLLLPLRLLTAKPVVYVANVDDADLPAARSAGAVGQYAGAQHAPLVTLSAKLEAEAAQLSEGEAAEFLRAYGIGVPGLLRLIRLAYEMLGLVTFFTAASKEVRAWPVTRGTTAPRAAGKIHTDMERGFIRAEVIGWEVLVQSGSLLTARDRGLVRLEGKDYVVQDGDVMLFRFAV
jgi:GTP-binding protein YchF